MTEPRGVTYPVFVFRIVILHTACDLTVHWNLFVESKQKILLFGLGQPKEEIVLKL